ncbi:uncharacterized protein LOC126251459 [Schistocerca nitens]|uniref:uncharacterized protein LOC126251459 n=1 Tax=Schistocerca nitens TaxID=7011 RepID=UPI00211983DA|nr:uncharacterized protein LOC126251459 [Schistocerca nitens]
MPPLAGVAGARGWPPLPLRNGLPPTLHRGSSRQLVLRRHWNWMPMFHGSRLLRSGRNEPPPQRRPPQRSPPPPRLPTQLSGRAFILTNKLAHESSYLGREDNEAAILAFCTILKAAALPHKRQQESRVPPRASPAALQEIAAPAVAASAGVAPLDSTTREVDVAQVAPLAPETQEEPAAALVDAPSCARRNPAVWTGAQSAADTTEVDAIELPDGNLAEAFSGASTLTMPARPESAGLPRKKASRASRASTTEAVKTVAGSSRSTAEPRPTTKTQPPPRSPAASRQPDADGSVAPPRRGTARADALQQTQPLPTANAFTGASVDVVPLDGDAPLPPPQNEPPPPPLIVVQWDGVYKDFQQKFDRVVTSSSRSQ